MKYVLAYKAGSEAEAVSKYESMGYSVVQRSKDGPRLGGGETSHHRGDTIEFRGSVLMQVTEERFEEIQRYGADGISGSSLADRLEERLAGHSTHREVFQQTRGMRSRGGTQYFYEDRRGSEEEANHG
jgi:hypothetical protein